LASLYSLPEPLEVLMPSRARLYEFIAVVESGAIERCYTEDSSMPENAAGVEGDHVVIHTSASAEALRHAIG
jgi:hypothetical protein